MRHIIHHVITVWGLTLSKNDRIVPSGCRGFLDHQFMQLQMLQDESNPDFVAEVIDLFVLHCQTDFQFLLSGF